MTFWAYANDRRGRLIESVGPFASRELAAAAIRAAAPTAYSYSVGYGTNGAHFDIRNERA